MDVEINDGRSSRKMDHGEISEWKKMSTIALENFAGKKEREAVKLRKCGLSSLRVLDT